jgi:hypothetical protein
MNIATLLGFKEGEKRELNPHWKKSLNPYDYKTADAQDWDKGVTYGMMNVEGNRRELICDCKDDDEQDEVYSREHEDTGAMDIPDAWVHFH